MVAKDNIPADEALHAAEMPLLQRRIVEMALAATGATNGGLFLWDDKGKSLSIDFHIVEGLFVNLPEARVRSRADGRPSGIALWVVETFAPYLCNDTGEDPHYARYFIDVGSLVAVPIPYQGRAIGVLTVSSRERGAFDRAQVDALSELAGSSAKFLRRAQLYETSRKGSPRPFLIKGMSPEWLEVEQRIELASPTDAPVLILGESGTGKDLVAHAIHFNSERSTEPFVTVNCAAIPETMLESILFGHKKGAFTGATFTKIGEFQKAHHGTLFLDEVGELPLALQAKVLRAVEQGEVQPLGSNDPPAQVDVRLLCATHRDLAARVREGSFRDDLYFRLSVMILELPPLRSYRDNLEVLAHVFLEQAAQRHHRRSPEISAGAMSLLQAYDYPGNVRELKNTMEHAVIMTTAGVIRAEHLPRSFRATPGPAVIGQSPPPTGTLRERREAWLAPLERQYLTALLRECDGNVREAARRAGINTVTMYRLLKKRGLKLSREVTLAGV